MGYYWVRLYDYDFERDQYDKGILLDEFYFKDIENRDIAKEKVRNKYIGETSKQIQFAKPRKKNGLYAVLMDSNKFFFDRFYLEIHTHCFYCHKEIKGKASEFPKTNISESNYIDYDLEDAENTAYFCSYNCKSDFSNSMRYEGVFQEKEAGEHGLVFGYIYLMYNRNEDKYYIGQTKFLPFFRWQEHIKSGGKGEITDISFSVLTEVRRKSNIGDEGNQEYLNNIEAWWIAKFKEEGKEVFNIANPRLTLEEYKRKFNEMISKQGQVSF